MAGCPGARCAAPRRAFHGHELALGPRRGAPARGAPSDVREGLRSFRVSVGAASSPRGPAARGPRGWRSLALGLPALRSFHELHGRGAGAACPGLGGQGCLMLSGAFAAWQGGGEGMQGRNPLSLANLTAGPWGCRSCSEAPTLAQVVLHGPPGLGPPGDGYLGRVQGRYRRRAA